MPTKKDIKQIENELRQILHILLKLYGSIARVKPSEHLKAEIDSISGVSE